ncbi:MAG: hypothetical protein PHU86_03410 [Patescibacteria group bacterium]|nr:hypothetical protein [Patescibacteria group bacterium]
MDAPSASKKHCACPLAPVIRIASGVAGITYNARCFCMKFEADGLDREVGFSACAVIKEKIQPNAKTFQEAAKVYKEVNGHYPWNDNISAENWLGDLLSQLDEAKQVCSYYFNDNH